MSLLSKYSKKQKVSFDENIVNKNEEKIKKYYKHGDVGVIITNSVEKGYMGHILEYIPGSQEVLIEKNEYVDENKLKKIIDIKKIDIIKQKDDTEPLNIIIYKKDDHYFIGLNEQNTEKILSNLKKINKNKTEDQILAMYDTKNFMYIRNFKSDNLSDLVNQLNQIELNEIKSQNIGTVKKHIPTYNIGEDDVNILTQNVENMSIISDNLNKQKINILIKELKQKVSNYDEKEDQNIEDELFEETIDIIHKNNILQDFYIVYKGNNKGNISEYALNKNIYKVFYDIKLRLSSSEIKSINKNEGIILKGKYKGKKVKKGMYIPPHLRFFIDSQDKIITTITMQKNGQYKKKLLTPNDVFYFDILLKDGNIGQLNEILPNNKLNITVRNEDNKTTTFINKIIEHNEIKEYLPGFKFSDSKIDLTENHDDENIFVNEDEENQYVTSVKDIDRVGQEITQYNKEQLEILNKITKYLKILNINKNEYELLYKVEEILNLLQNKVKQINYENIYEVYIINYIVILVIIYDLINNENVYNIDNVIDQLYKNKGLSLLDSEIDNIIFLDEKWSKNEFVNKIKESINTSREKIKTINKNVRMRSAKKEEIDTSYKNIIKQLLILIDKNIQNLLSTNVNILTRIDDVDINSLIKIGKNYIKDIIKKDINNLGEEKLIEWDSLSKEIIKKYKNELDNKFKLQPSKIIYKIISDNIYRIPYLLRDETNDKHKRYISLLYDNIKNDLLNEDNKKLEQLIERQSKKEYISENSLQEEDNSILKRKKNIDKREKIMSKRLKKITKQNLTLRDEEELLEAMIE